MKKRLLFALGGMFVLLVSLPLFAAFEAGVVSVRATIANALAVSPLSIEFGTVFPQEEFDADPFKVEASQAFKDSERTAIRYVLTQKPKPKGDRTESISVSEYNFAGPRYLFCESIAPPSDLEDPYYNHCYPNLCPYLSKHKDPTENPAELGGDQSVPPASRDPNLDYELDAPHGPNAPPAQGYFHKNYDERWIVDLITPCFEGECAQDWQWPGFEAPAGFSGETFGCDIWVEITELI